jgi:predicted GIY-YIG superfamily endonuclease
MYYTYILESLKDFKFYTGFTKDLKLRFEQHEKGLVKSTMEKKADTFCRTSSERSGRPSSERSGRPSVI